MIFSCWPGAIELDTSNQDVDLSTAFHLVASPANSWESLTAYVESSVSRAWLSAIELDTYLQRWIHTSTRRLWRKRLTFLLLPLGWSLGNEVEGEGELHVWSPVSVERDWATDLLSCNWIRWCLWVAWCWARWGNGLWQLANWLGKLGSFLKIGS